MFKGKRWDYKQRISRPEDFPGCIRLRVLAHGIGLNVYDFTLPKLTTIFSSSIVLLIEHRNDVQILKPRVASLKLRVENFDVISKYRVWTTELRIVARKAWRDRTISIVRDDKTTSLPIIKAKTKLFTGFLNSYKWNLLTNCAVWIKILG